MQDQVDKVYGMFAAAVAKSRGCGIAAVREGMGQGRCLMAQDALAANLVDRVGTLDEACARAMKLGAGGAQAMAAAAGIRYATALNHMAAEDLDEIVPGWEATVGADAAEQIRKAGVALVTQSARGIERIEAPGRLIAGPMKPHQTPTSDDAWDGPANEARLPNEESKLRAAHAWVDDEGDPDAKSSYKFIHHEVSESGEVGAANEKACSSGIAVCHGGRGGTTIPEGDKAGVEAHLQAHLDDAEHGEGDMDEEHEMALAELELERARADADGVPPPRSAGYRR